MNRYLLGRVGQALLVLWGAYTITYFILYLLPGDTLSIMLSASGIEVDALSPADLARRVPTTGWIAVCSSSTGTCSGRPCRVTSASRCHSTGP